MSKDIKVEIGAKNKTAKAFNAVRGSINRLKKSVFSLKGALVGLAGASGIGLSVQSILDYADAIDKARRLSNLSAEAQQKWNFVGNQSGVTAEEIAKSLGNFEKRISKLREKTGALYGFLKINNTAFLEQLKNTKDTTEALDLYIAKLGQMDKRSRGAFVDAAFSSTRLLKIFQNGVGDFKNLSDQAEKLDIILSNKLVLSMAKTKDELAIVGFQMRKVWAEVIHKLTPSIIEFSQAISRNRKVLAELGEALITVIRFLGRMVKAYRDAFAAIKQQINSLRVKSLTSDFDSLIKRAEALRRKRDELVRLASTPAVQNQKGGMELIAKRIKAVDDRYRSLRKQMEQVNKLQQEIVFGPAAKQSESKMPESLRNRVFDVATGNLPDPKKGAAAAKKNDALNQRLASQLDSVRQYLMSREMIEVQANERRKQIIQQNFERGLLDEQSAKLLLEDLERRHQENLTQIVNKGEWQRMQFQKLTRREKARSMLGELSSMMSMIQVTDKKTFRLSQIGAISQAVLSGMEGAARSMRFGIPLGPIFAALSWGMSLIRIAQIKSMKYGKSSAGGGGGAASAPNLNAATNAINKIPTNLQQRPKTILINLGDERYKSTDTIRMLIEDINEELADSGKDFNYAAA